CVRCGLCVKACPVQALSLPAGAPVPLLNGQRCISCSCCHEICPKDAIRMTQSPVLRWVKVFKGME
ncbi:MAG: 4Fe-4S binding protein, partial [Kiritimatiellia bacterium]